MGADCENDAGSLQCPTCLKLGIKDSFFCSQDCFKKNWVCSCFVEYRKWNCILTYLIFRVPTRQCTSRKVTFSITSKLRKQSHQIQLPATITRSPTSPSRALCDPCTRCPSTERCPSRSLIPFGGRTATPSTVARSRTGTRSKSSIRPAKMLCVRSAFLRERSLILLLLRQCPASRLIASMRLFTRLA